MITSISHPPSQSTHLLAPLVPPRGVSPPRLEHPHLHRLLYGLLRIPSISTRWVGAFVREKNNTVKFVQKMPAKCTIKNMSSCHCFPRKNHSSQVCQVSGLSWLANDTRPSTPKKRWFRIRESAQKCPKQFRFSCFFWVVICPEWFIILVV